MLISTRLLIQDIYSNITFEKTHFVTNMDAWVK